MDLALRVPCATCAVGIGTSCKWGDAPHDARVWIARSILGDVVSAAAPTPSAAKRRAKRVGPKPVQLDLPIDWTEAMGVSLAKYEVHETPSQSPKAAEVTEMVHVAQHAMAALERKTRKRVRS